MERSALMQATFDYAAVSSDTALQLRMSAERIRMRLKRSAEDIIAIGQELHDAKKQLGHGQFLPWLQAEFQMSEMTAVRFIQVAERFGDKSNKLLDLSPSVLYLLAAPSTSADIVDRVTSGEIAPNAAAIKEAKEAEARAKAEASRARGELDAAHAQMATMSEQLDGLQREAEALRKLPKLKPQVRTEIKKVEVVPEQVKEQIQALEERIAQVSRERDRIAEQYQQSVESLERAQSVTIIDGPIVDADDTAHVAEEATRLLAYWAELFRAYRGKPAFEAFEPIFCLIKSEA